MAKIIAEQMKWDNAVQMLRIRRAERETLLHRISEILVQDTRVAAAWVYGSVGRGDPDDLSDLDIRVVVADQHINAVCAERQTFAAQLGSLLLCQEAPQNCPPGGAFLLTLYDGQYGPQEVDWTWEPQSTARLWPQTRVVFDRVGLPPLEGDLPFAYQTVPEQTPLEMAIQRVWSFWGMGVVVGKYAARSPDEERMGLLWLMTEPLRGVQKYLGLPLSPKAEELPAHPHPAEKIALLRSLVAQMEALMPQLVIRGIPIFGAIFPAYTKYLAMIDQVIRANHA